MKKAQITESIYSSYMDQLRQGNRNGCRSLVEDLIKDDYDIHSIYLDLFQAALYEIGCLWESNQISVAVEHLASAITDELLNLLYPIIFNEEHIGKSAIITCIPNELHQIGARIVTDIFELNGWDGYFLGANTPVNDLLQMVDEKKPDILGLSMSLYMSTPYLEQSLTTLNTEFPGLPTIVGGQGFRWGGQELLIKFPNVQFVDSIISLEKMIQSL